MCNMPTKILQKRREEDKFVFQQDQTKIEAIDLEKVAMFQEMKNCGKTEFIAREDWIHSKGGLNSQHGQTMTEIFLNTKQNFVFQ